MIKGAVPTEAWMQLSRKRSDGQYGSDEKLVGMKLTLTPDADLEVVWAELWDELQSELGHEVVATVALPAPEVEDAEALEPVEVVKFTLAKRTDGKYQLEVYQNYGAKVGKYPELKYVADREPMWNQLAKVIVDESFKDLPVEYECSWWADWKYGNEYVKKDGTPGRYKDLVNLRPR